jgi:hypothetical protein
MAKYRRKVVGSSQHLVWELSDSCRRIKTLLLKNCTVHEKFVNFALRVNVLDDIKSGWLLHNEKGPAIERSGSSNSYYLEGTELTQKEWLIKTTKLGKILYE